MCVRRRKLYFMDAGQNQIFFTEISPYSRSGTVQPLSDIYPNLSTQSKIVGLYPGRTRSPNSGDNQDESFVCSPTAMMILSQESGTVSILNLPFECQFKLSATPERDRRVTSTWTATGWWINADDAGNLNAYNIGRLEGDDEGAEVKKVRFELGQTSLLERKRITGLACDRTGRWMLVCTASTDGDSGQRTASQTLLLMELVNDGSDSLDLSYVDEIVVALDNEEEEIRFVDGSMQLVNESFLVNMFTSRGKLVSYLVNSTGKVRLVLSEPLVDGAVTSVTPTGNSLAVTLVPNHTHSPESLFFLHLDHRYASSHCN